MFSQNYLSNRQYNESMSEMIEVKSIVGKVPAYLVTPTGKCRGGLIVIHEVWSLAPHIKDVAERFAAEGYLVLAPDLLSGDIELELITGMQEDLFNPEKRNQAQPELRKHMAPIMNPDFAAKTVERLNDCFEYLYSRPETDKKVGVTGFCFGGTYSFSLAIQEPRLKLAIPFYGHSDQSVDELKKITCRVLAFYGENDENLMKSLPQLKQNMATNYSTNQKWRT